MENNRTFLEKLLDGAEVEWRTLGEVSELRNTGVDKKINESEKSVRLLNFTDVFNNQYLSNSTPTMIVTASDKKIIDCNILKGDLFITPTSEILDEIGQSAVALENIDNAVYSYHIMRIRIHDTNFLLPEFLNYLFRTSQIKQQIRKNAQGITRFGLTLPRWKSLVIPIPPLSVQTEIVKILDALTALTSELTSELTLRRKQYEYYREKLLSHNDSENSSQQKVDKDKLFSTSNIQWLHLNEIYKFQYGIGNKIPTIGGEYPVYGSNGIVGSHYEYNSEDAPVIGHIGAYAGIVNWAEGKHFVTYNGIICNKINDNVNSRYAYYLLLSQNFIDKANKASQPFISYDILNKCIVPVPPIGEQQRIVSILDKFETLTNSITEGLPLAIEQNQKRYEYYRELLLNFPGRE